MLKQKDPLSGNWQEFSYDGMGRLTQIQFPINGSLRPIINDIRYNKANLMLGYTLPLSGITATQGFDPQNDRIKSIAFTGPTYLSYKNQQNAAILQKMNKLNLPQFNQDPVVTGNALPYFTQTYTYDPAGNRTQLTQKEAADTTQFTYDYDRMNQLVSYAMKVNNADPVEFKYTYDSQGNRTQLMQGSTTLTTDFDTTTNKPNGYWFGAQKNDENHIEFVYDKNGNRTAKQLKTPKNELLLDITYAWNAQNRMTRYTLNGITQTNKYQFSGPRYEKKEASPEGTETTRFYPDDSLRLLSEKVTDAKGQKSYAYIYLGTQKLARISKNADTQKDEVSYFLNDALGTPAWITYEHTASPNAPVLISQNLRDPWGNEMGSTLFSQTPVRDFTGKQQDTLSNLYDFGFRYYDSLLGTWIGKDLVPPDYTSPLSLNEYLYALNNPTMYTDPNGKFAVIAPLVIAATAVVMNPVALETARAEWASTKGILKDIVLGVTGEKAVGAALEYGTAKWAARGASNQASKTLLGSPAYVPNAGGEITSFVTKSEDQFFRVYSNSSKGSFLTKIRPESSEAAIKGLALPPGNKASFIQEVVVPKGIRLQESTALPAFGQPGGLQQFEVLNKVDLNALHFGEGVPFK
ncbi:MAG: RHS repeat-associated core domain-containing protein [Candidatus Margulisiibacteriota bacterium]